MEVIHMLIKMLVIFFIIAVVVTAVFAVITFYYRNKYNKALTDSSVSDTEFESVCTRGTVAIRLTAFFGIIAALLAIAIVVTMIVAATGNTGKADAVDPTPPPGAEEVDAAEDEEDTADDADVISDDIVFYNDKVQGKGNGKNFNFGPNAYKTAKRGYDARDELLRRCEKDPVLLAAVDSWLDVNLGTRLCGVFFEDNAEWRQAVADYAEAMVYDPQLFHDSYEATYGLIMEESSPLVKAIKSDEVMDQMYMLPKQYSRSGKIPDLIVCATDHEKGHYLVLKFKIKGDTFRVCFRMECGFQPTNCAKKLDTQAETTVTIGTGGSKKTVRPGNKKPSNPGNGGGNKSNPKQKGNGCRDKQNWTTSGGGRVEKRTDTPTGGGNSRPNTQDPPSGGATKVDQGPGGGSKAPDKPKDPPAVDSGNGKVDGDD